MANSRSLKKKDLLEQVEYLKMLVEGRHLDGARARIKHLHIENGQIDGAFEGEVVHVIAAHMIATFEAIGATNYFTVDLNHEEFGPFSLTMQRKVGQTPAQIAQELRDVLRRAVESNTDVECAADSWLIDARRLIRAGS